MTHRIPVLGGLVAAALVAAAPAQAVRKTGVRSTISAPAVLPGCDRAGVASFPNLAVDSGDPRRMSAV